MSVQERPDELIRLLRPEFAGRTGADSPASLTWGKIMLIPPAGAPVTTYPVTVAGLLAALSAATVAGSMIWVPPGSFDTAITIPANIALVALGEKVSINGQWTLNSGVVVANVVQTQSDSSAGALSGVVGPSSGIAYMKNCSFTVTNSGAGDAYAVNQSGAGELWLWGCSTYGNATGGGSGYGARQSAGTLYVSDDGRHRGSTGKFSGTVQLFSLDDVIRLKTPGGFTRLYNADTAGVGLAAALSAASSGDVLELPPRTIAGDQTIPAGVRVVGGASRSDTVLTGEITGGSGCLLQNLAVTRTANDVNTLKGIVVAAAISITLVGVSITLTQSGAGDARCLSAEANGAIINARQSFLSPTASGGGTGYANWVDTGTTAIIRGHYNYVAAGQVANTNTNINVYANRANTISYLIGSPDFGDRAAWDVVDFENYHARDIYNDAPQRHTPLPGTNGNIIIDDGTKWISGPPTGAASGLLDYYDGDVSNPPTQVELISVIGSPGGKGQGYHAILNDNGGYDNEYLVASDGLYWWLTTLAKASGVDPSFQIDDDSYDLAFVNGVLGRQEAVVSKVVSSTRYQVYAYWDENGFLSFAKRSVPSRTWTKYTTAISIAGVDAHYFISMGIDSDGYLHIAYNMHNDPLVYRKSSNTIATFDGTFGGTLSMLGTNESNVAYPQFIHDNNGNLYFTFRDGIAADADHYFYQYSTSTGWSKMTGTGTAGKLIDGKNSTPDESAYMFQLRFDDNDELHIAWSWREDVGDDYHDVSYVKWNRTTFEKADGTAQTVPITHENCEIADAVAQGLNGPYFGFVDADSSGNPVIVYHYDDGSGNWQIWATFWTGAAWSSDQVSSAASDNESYTLAIDRTTDTAYILWANVNVETGLMVWISDAGDFTTWTNKNIWPVEDMTAWGVRHDWHLWNETGVMGIVLEKWTGAVGVLPVKMLEWEP